MNIDDVPGLVRNGDGTVTFNPAGFVVLPEDTYDLMRKATVRDSIRFGGGDQSNGAQSDLIDWAFTSPQRDDTNNGDWHAREKNKKWLT